MLCTTQNNVIQHVTIYFFRFPMHVFISQWTFHLLVAWRHLVCVCVLTYMYRNAYGLATTFPSCKKYTFFERYCARFQFHNIDIDTEWGRRDIYGYEIRIITFLHQIWGELSLFQINNFAWIQDFPAIWRNKCNIFE